jgi:hypothetical protein
VDSNPDLPADDDSPGAQPPKRGIFLRILYRIYANYLGVTPPTPAQERMAAVILIAGVVLGLLSVVAVVFFLWQAMASMGGRR